MAMLDGLLGPLSDLLDAIVADPQQRDAAKLKLLDLQRQRGLGAFEAALSAADGWTRRARPSFLYVMYALLLWAIPMGMLAAFRPGLADSIARSMSVYLNGLPEPLYTLFGTGYLGYTVARQWGKARGSGG